MSCSNALRHGACCKAISSELGLGRVKTQTCCGAVERRSQESGVPPLSREARFSAPIDAEVKKSLKTLRLLRFWCAAHVWPFMVLCVEPRVILEALWNRILTIFDLHTFHAARVKTRSATTRLAMSAYGQLPDVLA